MEKRIKWVDAARCFGMFAIYLGHFGDLAGRGCAFVYTHHVALFFLLSGCMESISHEADFLTYLKKIIKNILVPWLFFAVCAVFYSVLERNAGIHTAWDLMKKVLCGTINDQFIAGALWFLTCLAVMKVLFFFIRKLKNKALILLVCLALHFVEIRFDIPRFFNFYRALRFLIYYAIGYAAFPAICKALSPETRRDRILLALSGVAALCFSGAVYFGVNPTAFLSGIPYVKHLSPILNALVIIWLYLICARLCENVSLFGRLGRDSLYLCGSEYFIKSLAASLIPALGLQLNLSTPMLVYVYSAALILGAYRLLVPLEKRLLGAIYRLPQYLKY